MHGGVAAGGPAGTAADEGGVIDLSDDELTGADAGPLHLRVAAQAKVGIGLDEHLVVHGAVRLMAGSATLAHGVVLEDDAARLFAMAGGALLVDFSHDQPARWLHDVASMRVMALDAVHPAFADRMVLGQVELGLDVKVAIEAGGRLEAGIDDELAASAACGDMLAAWAVAGFTTTERERGTGRAVIGCGFDMQACMWRRGEGAGVLGVTFGAGGIAHYGGAVDWRRGDEMSIQTRAGAEDDEGERREPANRDERRETKDRRPKTERPPGHAGENVARPAAA